MTDNQYVIAKLQRILDEKTEYLEVGGSVVDESIHAAMKFVRTLSILDGKTKCLELDGALIDESIHAAMKFVRTLSKLPNIPTPNMELHPEGLVSLIWRVKDEGVIKLSFDLNGVITCKAYAEGGRVFSGQFREKHKEND